MERQPLKSLKFLLWQRLMKRFALEPGRARASQAYVDTLVVPITNADETLQDITIESITRTINLFGEYQMLGTDLLPGERWRILGASARQESGVYAFNLIQITRPGGVTFPLIFYSGGTVWLFLLVNGLVRIEYGWTMQASLQDYTDPGTARFSIMCIKETIG